MKVNSPSIYFNARPIHHTQEYQGDSIMTVFYIPSYGDHKTQAIFCVSAYGAIYKPVFIGPRTISRGKNYYLRGVIISLRGIYAELRGENHSRR